MGPFVNVDDRYRLRRHMHRLLRNWRRHDRGLDRVCGHPLQTIRRQNRAERTDRTPDRSMREHPPSQSGSDPDNTLVLHLVVCQGTLRLHLFAIMSKFEEFRRHAGCVRHLVMEVRDIGIVPISMETVLDSRERTRTWMSRACSPSPVVFAGTRL